MMGNGLAIPSRYAILRMISISRWMIPLRAAGLVWCLGQMCWRRRWILRTGRQVDAPIIAMTPRGKPITQARIRELSSGPGVTIVCGRFEGFDERIFDARPQIEQVSMGDIILSGGEMGALMLLDACIRLLPGVMGAAYSGEEESFEQGILEYPHYTRPNDWEGRMIPQVLRSGDHAKIEAWRKAQAENDTRLRRPDLWERYIAARDKPASGARQK